MTDIIIADHQEVFRAGLIEVFGSCDDIRIVGTPECRRQLIAAMIALSPHVLIVSRKFLRRFSRIGRILKRRSTALLVLTQDDDPVNYASLMGARGVLHRSMEGSEIIDVVRSAARAEASPREVTAGTLENPPSRPAA